MSKPNIPTWLIPLALIAAAVAVHSGTLGHGFLVDDDHFLEGYWTAGYSHLTDVFFRTAFQHYAPLYLAVNYWLFEHYGQAPQVFHVINITLFALNITLFYILIRAWTQSTVLAALSALLMTVHPVHAFIVGYKTGNFVFYTTLLQQLCLLLLWRSTRDGKTGRAGRIASYALYVVAILSVEWTMLFPLYALMMLRVCGGKSWRDSLRLCFPYIVLAAVQAALYLLMVGPRAGLLERFLAADILPTEYVGLWGYFLAKYGLTVVAVHGTGYMWDLAAVPDPAWLWAGWGTWAAVGGAVLFGGLRPQRWGAFGGVWFLTGWVLVLPAMLAHPELGFVFEPHWVYFASFGFFLLIARGLLAVGRRLPSAVNIIGLAAIALLCVAVTLQMQRVTRTEEAFCEYWLSYSPHNRLPMSRLAQIYTEQGRLRAALAIHHRLLAAGDGQEYRELNNIAVLRHRLGDLDEAEARLRESLTREPGFAAAWNNLGLVLQDRGRTDDAIDAFRAALRHNPNMVHARLNLAYLYLREGRNDEAAAAIAPLTRAVVNPEYDREALIITAIIAARQQDAAQLSRVYAVLQERHPGAAARIRLADQLAAFGMLEEARRAWPSR